MFINPLVFYLLGLVVMLLLLYFFHQQIVKYFSAISFLTFGNSKFGVYAFFLFFLPGVILHELAHLLMASVLNVPTGNLMIFPRQEEREMPGGGKAWSLGKVSSAETDPLRSSLIGFAPMIIGVLSLIAIVDFGLGIKSFNQITSFAFTWKNLLLFYCLLTFTNTMFLSEEDRTSIWALPSLLIILLLFSRAMGLVGILVAVESIFLQIVSPLILSFSLTLLVDFIFLIPLVLLTGVLLRLRG